MKGDGVAEIKTAISQEVPRLNFPFGGRDFFFYMDHFKDLSFFGLGLQGIFLTQKHTGGSFVVRESFFFRWFRHVCRRHVLWAEALRLLVDENIPQEFLEGPATKTS